MMLWRGLWWRGQGTSGPTSDAFAWRSCRVETLIRKALSMIWYVCRISFCRPRPGNIIEEGHCRGDMLGRGRLEGGGSQVNNDVQLSEKLNSPTE